MLYLQLAKNKKVRKFRRTIILYNCEIEQCKNAAIDSCLHCGKYFCEECSTASIVTVPLLCSNCYDNICYRSLSVLHELNNYYDTL